MHINYIKKREKGKHLTLSERGKIEAFLKAGYTKRQIAEEIGVSERTIYREVNRGKISLLNSDLTIREEYASDYAQSKYRENQRKKEGSLKIGNNIKLANKIEHLIIKERYSPYGAINKIKETEEVNFCLKTLYNYIHKGIFYKLKETHLPYKKIYKGKYIYDKKIRKTGGISIEKRADIINSREEIGHWEMDTVVGKKGTKSCLLVLTERVSRKEIIIKLASKSSACVIEALRGLQKRYPKTFKDRFKSITSDNGVEFMDSKSVEEMGIKYFYAHSYCSYERGSNENNNKLIRRFIKKGEDIGKYSKSFIKKIERFMNEYPRKIFNGKSANYVYEKNYALY